MDMRSFKLHSVNDIPHLRVREEWKRTERGAKEKEPSGEEENFELLSLRRQEVILHGCPSPLSLSFCRPTDRSLEI